MQIHNSSVSVLLVIIVLDYLTGLCVALVEKKISSSIGRKGIFQKCGILICVLLSALIDSLAGYPQTNPIVLIFFIVNESFSILENLVKLNVPIPKILISHLKVFQENETTEANQK